MYGLPPKRELLEPKVELARDEYEALDAQTEDEAFEEPKTEKKELSEDDDGALDAQTEDEAFEDDDGAFEEAEQ